MKLSNTSLSKLPEEIERPHYDRSALTPGIVHIGLGNFHRAHQSWYVHRLMQQGTAMDWAIIGAGVRAEDAAMREKLKAQDCLTTLIALDPEGRSAEITGSMIDYVPVEAGHAPLIAAMSRPEIRIVSLTVTEGGYYLDAATGAFDANHPDIRHDAGNLSTPRTAFGAILAALAVRKAAGVAPFTVLSCDNLQGNGRITKQTVMGLAKLNDPELAEWVAENVSFPNSMVDCIVPATGPDEQALAKAMGVDDPACVTHERFRQWVIEDDFCNGRPDWDQVGAVFTQDVHAFEAMKLRMLNAGHQILANAGELLSLATISDCMAHPLVSGLFDKVEREEIAPFVPAVPGITAEDYLALISRRFANPEIKDTTRRVAFDGTSRHPGFLLPTLRDALTAGASIEGFALVEALWARMCAGQREDGSTIAPNDPQWDALNAASLAARDRPHAWLEQSSIYGDLASAEPFAAKFETWLSRIWEQGVDKTLRMYLS